jgi:HK97 family phage major capsid protein
MEAFLTRQSIPRSVLSVRASAGDNPARILSELNGAFTDFKTRHDRRMEEIEAAIGDTNIKIAGLQLGIGRTGSGVHATQALRELGSFAKTGEVGDIRAAMDSGSGAAGGYVVKPELSREILRRQADLSPMRRLARRRDGFEGAGTTLR